MKKYFIVCFMSAAMAMGSSSCKKALTEKLHSSLAPQNFYKTTDDAEAALNGAFAPLKWQPYYQRGIYLATDLSADIFHPSNANADRQQMYRATYTPFNGILNNFWSNSYTAIKNANDVIRYVPAMTVDAASKNNIVGNARFLRGMAYFDLVRMFGDVPIVLINNGDENLFPSRNPAKDVYAQVVEDLKFAEANCVHAHEIPSEKTGRISSEAASAMLARVYLQRASTSYGEASDNQNALASCNKVIAYSAAHPSDIGLQSSYADVFDVNKKNGPESIFAIQFGSSGNNVNITNLMFNPASAGGFGSLLPDASFYNSFDVDDGRKAVCVGVVDAGVTYVSKYNDPYVAPNALGGNNWLVLRYADVLLMQSEALHKINPADVNKFSGINLVRTRAGFPAVKLLNAVNTPTAEAFVTALLNERLWELNIEGHRRFDLIRFNKYISTKAAQGFTVSTERLLYPIPQVERDVNKNLTQNQGY